MTTTLFIIAITEILFVTLFTIGIIFYCRVINEWRIHRLINKAIRTFGFEDNRTIAISDFAEYSSYKEVKKFYKALAN